MKKHQIDAYLITGTDPHLSEYISGRWETRKWISGFTGSYGKVLVTLNDVLLWTDTRYFLQAAEELKGTGIRLMKDRVPEAVSLEEWALKNLKRGNKIAFDGSTISAAEATQLTSKLAANGINFSIDHDLVDKFGWIGLFSPNLEPMNIRLILPENRGLRSSIWFGKYSNRRILIQLLSLLDDLAWVFNLRGNEIEYTPLVSAYGYLDQENVWLFINPGRLGPAFRNVLEEEGIIIKPYGDFYSFIKRITNKRIQIDPIRTNFKVTRSLSDHNEIDSSVAVVTKLKAVKDHNEIENIRNAHVKDGSHGLFAFG